MNNKERYQKYKEAWNKRNREYYKKNKKVANLYYWKLLAKHHELKGEDLQEQYIRQEEKCFYCKVQLDDKNEPCVEHYYPKNNSRIVISFKHCNRLKWDMTGDEFLIFVREYISRF